MALTLRIPHLLLAAAVAGVATTFVVLRQSGPPANVDLAKLPPAGTVFRDCPSCGEMVWLPAGSFVMGSAPAELERGADEGPQHKVTLRQPFAIGKYEVTFAEWDACVADGGCNRYRPADDGWGRGRRPVINISWQDAQSYIDWISRKTGQRYRLPSEAEWEYAARAGQRGVFGGSDCLSAAQANIDGRYDYGKCPVDANGYIQRTVDVGHYRANAFGLHDMLGNVFEWTADDWHESYHGAPSSSKRWEKGDPEWHPVRGGCWYSQPGMARVANRYGLDGGFRSNTVGFRLARDAG